MSQPTILIVEDEKKLSRVLQLELEYEDYRTETADNGKDALRLITEKEWDLVLLDIMLPGLSGVEVLRRVRKSGDVTPIILLTARDEVHDKVNGLDQGANDYVTKPFQIEELLARIRVHLRNTPVQKAEKNVLELGELSVNLDSREVKRANEQIELTPREDDLIVCLLEYKN